MEDNRYGRQDFSLSSLLHVQNFIVIIYSFLPFKCASSQYILSITEGVLKRSPLNSMCKLHITGVNYLPTRGDH